MSDNIKKDVGSEHFTYVRKGILQGSSGPTLLTSPRLIGMLEATPPSPPDHPDFYYPELEELLPVNLTVKLESQPAIEISIASANVTDIMQTLGDALEDFTISFSQRKITVAGPGTLKYFAFLESDSPDFARILKFPFQNAYAATSINHVDQGALAKNRETFIQKYENNLSDAVNRALSSLASNLEAHHVYLSDPFAVPKFVNTIENASILEPITRDGSVVGLILRDRAYLGTEHNLSPQELERLFTLTDAYGYESLNLIDLGVVDGQPIRISEVTTGDGGTPRKYEADFQDWGNANAVADTRGDGKSVLPCSVYTLDNDTIPILEVLDGCMVRLDYPDPLTEDLVPINSVLVIKGSSHNNGTYLVESVCDSNTLQIRPYEKGRDVLLSSGALGEATLRMGSFPDFSPDQELYLWFDTPVLETNILHGIGLFYAQHCTLKDLLQDTLTSSTIPGLSTDDILVRSLRSIRGPNSRDYRSLLIGELTTDRGDQVSLESLSGRRLLGRDKFDINGADANKDVINDKGATYKEVDGSKAIAHTPIPLTLFGAGHSDPSFSPVGYSPDIEADKFATRPESGPYTGLLKNGSILEVSEDTFYPTDVGFTVLLTPVLDLTELAVEDRPAMKVWMIERWVSPKKVILGCVDSPGFYAQTSSADIEVSFVIGQRMGRNISGGAVLRLDGATGSPLSATQITALVLTGSEGLTGVVSAHKIHLDGVVDFYNKEQYSVIPAVGADKHLLVNINILHTPQIIDMLHPVNGFSDATVHTAVVGTLLDDLAYWKITDNENGTHRVSILNKRVAGCTLVELTTFDGRLDGLFLVDSISCNHEGYLEVYLQYLDGTPASIGNNLEGGYLRFYHMVTGYNLKHRSTSIANFNGESKVTSSVHFSGIGKGNGYENPVNHVARFTGFGSLDSIVEIAVSDIDQVPYPHMEGNTLVNAPSGDDPNQAKFGLSVTVTAPSEAGILTYSSSWPIAELARHIEQASGGIGIKAVAETRSRSLIKRMALQGDVVKDDGSVVTDSDVSPKAAAMVAMQVLDSTHLYENDPINRDPSLIVSTMYPGTKDAAQVDISTVKPVTSGVDSKAAAVFHLGESVFNRSQDRAYWAVTLENPTPENPNHPERLILYKKTRGEADLPLYLLVEFDAINAEGCSYFEEEDAAYLRIRFSGTLTAQDVFTAVQSMQDFAAISVEDISWEINLSSLLGVTPVAGKKQQIFAPRIISQLYINEAVEAVNGDVVITDGIFSIRYSESQELSGVGSDLIPVNHTFPGMPLSLLSIDEEMSSSYYTGMTHSARQSLGERGYVHTRGTVVAVGSQTVEWDPVEQAYPKDVGRYIRFTTTINDVTLTIYRTIVAVRDNLYLLDRPFTQEDLNADGIDPADSREFSYYLYGRQWDAYLANVAIYHYLTFPEIVPGSPAGIQGNIPFIHEPNFSKTALLIPSMVGTVMQRERLLELATVTDVYSDPAYNGKEPELIPWEFWTFVVPREHYIERLPNNEEIDELWSMSPTVAWQGDENHMINVPSLSRNMATSVASDGLLSITTESGPVFELPYKEIGTLGAIIADGDWVVGDVPDHGIDGLRIANPRLLAVSYRGDPSIVTGGVDAVASNVYVGDTVIVVSGDVVQSRVITTVRNYSSDGESTQELFITWAGGAMDPIPSPGDTYYIIDQYEYRKFSSKDITYGLPFESPDKQLLLRFGTNWKTPLLQVEQINNPYMASAIVHGAKTKNTHLLAPYGGVRAMLWDNISANNFFADSEDVKLSLATPTGSLDYPYDETVAADAFKRDLGYSDPLGNRMATVADRAARNLWTLNLHPHIPDGAIITGIKISGLVEWSYMIIKHGKIYYCPFNESFISGNGVLTNEQKKAADPLGDTPETAVKFRVYQTRLVEDNILNDCLAFDTTTENAGGAEWTIGGSPVSSAHGVRWAGGVPYLRTWSIELSDLTWNIERNDLLELAIDSLDLNLSGESWRAYIPFKKRVEEDEMTTMEKNFNGAWYEFAGPSSQTGTADPRSKLFLWVTCVKITYTYNGISTSVGESDGFISF